VARVKVGDTVHVPGSIFPHHEQPKSGYWVGKTVSTKAGGKGDIGVLCEGEDELFTWARNVVATWLVRDVD
jgi:hypothetical protein